MMHFRGWILADYFEIGCSFSGQIWVQAVSGWDQERLESHNQLEVSSVSRQ